MNLVILLATNLFLVPNGYTMTNNLNTLGQQTADNLNARFQSTPAQCNNNDSPYYCSGIVLRTVDAMPQATSYSWQATTDARGNTIAFSYIRSDIVNASQSIWELTYAGSGLIIKDDNTAKSENKEYAMNCAFPSNANSNKRYNGCGDPITNNKNSDKIKTQFPDYSTCYQQGVYSAQDWYNKYYFMGTINEIDSCSFNAQDPGQFMTNIETQNMIHTNLSSYSARWNEIPIPLEGPGAWDQNNQGNDAIEAFWYDPKVNTSTGLGLAHAQYDQQGYYNLTGQVIPIVQLNPNNITAPFSYSSADQKI